MTEIEKKALALLNEVERDQGDSDLTRRIIRELPLDEALCRAIEQHEAFKQEVSDVMTYIKELYPTLPRNFHRFIIPKPTVDPLVEAMAECGVDPFESWADQLREALAKRGFKIVEDV